MRSIVWLYRGIPRPSQTYPAGTFYAPLTRMRALSRSFVCGLILTFALTIAPSAASWAEPLTLLMVPPQAGVAGDSPFSEPQAKSINLIRIGPRVGVSRTSPSAMDQKEDFQQYDVAAIFG